jgi:predicted flap endonuclease-1-like 5' DNA nuclease
LALRPEIRAPQTGEKRQGRGFTTQELKEAGISLSDARWMAIPIDTRRRSSHPDNVSALKDYLKGIQKLGKKAKVPKPKAKPKEPTPAKPSPELIETDLTELTGVTKKLAETLVTVGITSIRELSHTKPRRLIRATTLKRNRAEKIIDAAKRHLREKTRIAREEKAQLPQISELKHLPEINRSDIKLLKELGVLSLEDLKSENTRDLSLLTGIAESRIKNWIKVILSLPKEA